jgi:putative oligomerization/nucleic acid binding protein/phospholipase D-like protein
VTIILEAEGGRSVVLVRQAGSAAMSLWDVLVSIFWFMLLCAWIWLLISILTDIFRDHELSGWGKALWILFIIVIPWLGALVYLIARGRSMNERSLAQARHQDQAFRRYVQDAASSSPSMADELAKLADLRDRGTISAEEFAQAKARLLGSNPSGATSAPPYERTSA